MKSLLINTTSFEATGHGFPEDEDFGRGRRPVIEFLGTKPVTMPPGYPNKPASATGCRPRPSGNMPARADADGVLVGQRDEARLSKLCWLRQPVGP